MSRNKKKHPDNVESFTTISPKLDENTYIKSPSILVWVLSTILFCFFSSTIAPLYISFDKVTETAPVDTIHKVLGIIGICSFLIVPVYLTIFKEPYEDEKADKKSTSWGTRFTLIEGQGLIASIINTAIAAVIGLPIIALTFFKPIFRALILLISFSYLGLPGGESRLFVIIVMSDILLWYINMIFPKWGFNPAEIAAVVFRVKKRPVLLNICTLFYIFYTALIYYFLSSMGYNSEPGYQDIKGEREILLVASWIFATIYIRLPFILNALEALDIIGYLKKIPGRYIFFHVIILAISFIAYMWPYFMG
jgi:multisubunit Na+/H+ antiporter MnhG subunit